MILNWNAGEHLARCLGSVLATVSPNVRVIVLDNGSTDGSLENAHAAAPRIQVIRFGKNLGFAAAYNAGIRNSSEEFVVLLNPDTLVENPLWLSDLVDVAQRNRSIAAVATKLVFMDQPDRINSAGATAYWWTGAVDIGFGQLDRAQFGTDHRPFAASGGAMLVRRDAFLEVGGFDDAMFAYVEDVDLSWRFRLRGFGIAFAPNVVVKHVFSVTLGPLSPFHIYLTHRNFLRAMLRNYSAGTLLRGLPAYALWTVVKLGWAVFFERSSSLAGALLRAVGWNAIMLRDTLRVRQETQATRLVEDNAILKVMAPRGFEPLQSLRRRLELVRDRSGAPP